MRHDRLVLCYHAVSRDWPVATAVRPDDFRRQIELLVERGYRGATFTEIVGAQAGRRLAAVTFDDAHLSVWQHARPVLAEHGWPGTVFVPTAYPARNDLMLWRGNEPWHDTPWRDELRCMDWDQVHRLSDEGWEVGSHTCSHPVLPQVDDETLEQELVGSRAELEERLRRPCTSVAYPYGAVDGRVLAMTRRAGYVAGAATQGGSVDSALERRREVVSRTDGARTFALKTRPSVRRVLAKPTVDRIKSRLQAVQAPT